MATDNSPVVTEEKLLYFYNTYLKPYINAESGGHAIKNEDDLLPLEQRETMVLNTPLMGSDDSTNEVTVLDVDTNVDLSVIHAPGTRTPDEFEVAITNPQEGQVMRYNATSEQWENGDDYHVYSTDERVVGKWIDGKPLYEKIIITNNTISQGDNYTDLNIANLEVCFVKDGYFKYNDVYNDGTEPIYYPLNIYKVKWSSWTTLDFGISTFVQRNHTTGIFRIVSRSSAAVTNIVQSVVVIRYTKTTDTV